MSPIVYKDKTQRNLVSRRMPVTVPEIPAEIALELCRYVTDQLRSEQVQSLASKIIEQVGYDDGLLEVIDSSDPRLPDLRVRFDAALQTLGVQLPNQHDATMGLAREIAREIVSGQISPDKGARRKSDDVCLLPGAAKELDIFEGLDSELEDVFDPTRQQQVRSQIVEEAKLLLESEEEQVPRTD